MAIGDKRIIDWSIWVSLPDLEVQQLSFLPLKMQWGCCDVGDHGNWTVGIRVI